MTKLSGGQRKEIVSLLSSIIQRAQDIENEIKATRPDGEVSLSANPNFMIHILHRIDKQLEELGEK